MAYTAKLLAVGRTSNGAFTFKVAYDDGLGGVAIIKDYVKGTPIGTYLEDQVAVELPYLDKQAADLAAAQAKVNQTIAPTVIIPHVPTQDEIDATDFFALRAKLKLMDKAIANGDKKNTDQDYIDLVTAYKLDFKQEYILDIRYN